MLWGKKGPGSVRHTELYELDVLPHAYMVSPKKKLLKRIARAIGADPSLVVPYNPKIRRTFREIIGL